jgi:hypothetical protein
MDKIVMTFTGLLIVGLGAITFFCDMPEQGLILLLIGTVISFLGVPQNENSNTNTNVDSNDTTKNT